MPGPIGRPLPSAVTQQPVSGKLAPGGGSYAVKPPMGPPAPAPAKGPMNVPQLIPGLGAAVTNAAGVKAPTKTAPKPSAGDSNPYAGTKPYNPTPQTPQQIAAQLNKLLAALGAQGVHVPPAVAIGHIASLVNQLPTHANVPGKFSLGSVAKALTPGKNTPGYVDPEAAAKAAAEAQYGGAVSADQRNVNQTTAQNTQNLTDIQNWYNNMTSMAKTNAADDSSGYAAAVQGTGNLGSVATALGMGQGSDGANTIDQTGSILNAAARMAQSSGKQFDNNLITSMGQQGVADYQSQKNKDAVALANLQGQLDSDLKAKGAAFTTAKDAATQANTTNAQNYSTALGNINSAYHNNFQSNLKNKQDRISELAGLNSQYSNQGMNAIRTRLAGLSTAAAVAAIPGQQAVAGAKANQYNANAYKTWASGQADILKAQTAKYAAQMKAQGGSLTANTPAANTARFNLAGTIFKTISGDPRVFTHDPISGAVALKDPKLAQTEIAAMLVNSGLDPRSGFGKLLASTSAAMLLSGGAPTPK